MKWNEMKCYNFQLIDVYTQIRFLLLLCPLGWGCRINRRNLCRRVRRLNECLEYNTKQSDGEVTVMLELWGMWNIPSFPLISGPLWSGMAAPGGPSLSVR